MTVDNAVPGIAGLARAFDAGETTSVAATKAYLNRIGVENAALNAFITVLDKSALKEAAASDDRRAQNKTRGPLDGIPIALKDNIDVAGVPTTGGIEAYCKNVPDQDADVVRRLREAGAVILGKLNMHEGAHGATTANEAYGYCQNPHKPGFTPGGSSGGSGAALAADLCAGALGTDTLGSVRIPASFCGIAGLKPTYGLVSTRGVMPLSYALDHVGPMARSCEDLTLMLTAIAGFDPNDPAGRHGPTDFSTALGTPKSLTGLKIGYFADLNTVNGGTVDPAVSVAYAKAINRLRDLGARLGTVTWDGYDPAFVLPKAMLLIEADLANIHMDMLNENPLGFTALFRSGIDFGLAQSAPKLAKALRIIEQVRPVARRLFSSMDALVTPTTPVPAFSFDTAMPKTITTFTAFANYAGCPALSVPMGKTEGGLPLGLQVVTPKRKEATALRIGSAFEG
ncbi:MAG: amidase [Rhodospirillaceae bacterium]|nr:amidase [Rhodospirillaceae bacterium]